MLGLVNIDLYFEEKVLRADGLTLAVSQHFLLDRGTLVLLFLGDDEEEVGD